MTEANWLALTNPFSISAVFFQPLSTWTGGRCGSLLQAGCRFAHYLREKSVCFSRLPLVEPVVAQGKVRLSGNGPPAILNRKSKDRVKGL